MIWGRAFYLQVFFSKNAITSIVYNLCSWLEPLFFTMQLYVEMPTPRVVDLLLKKYSAKVINCKRIEFSESEVVYEEGRKKYIL